MDKYVANTPEYIQPKLERGIPTGEHEALSRLCQSKTSVLSEGSGSSAKLRLLIVAQTFKFLQALFGSECSHCIKALNNARDEWRFAVTCEDKLTATTADIIKCHPQVVEETGTGAVVASGGPSVTKQVSVDKVGGHGGYAHW